MEEELDYVLLLDYVLYRTDVMWNLVCHENAVTIEFVELFFL